MATDKGRSKEKNAPRERADKVRFLGLRGFTAVLAREIRRRALRSKDPEALMNDFCVILLKSLRWPKLDILSFVPANDGEEVFVWTVRRIKDFTQFEPEYGPLLQLLFSHVESFVFSPCLRNYEREATLRPREAYGVASPTDLVDIVLESQCEILGYFGGAA